MIFLVYLNEKLTFTNDHEIRQGFLTSTLITKRFIHVGTISVTIAAFGLILTGIFSLDRAGPGGISNAATRHEIFIIIYNLRLMCQQNFSANIIGVIGLFAPTITLLLWKLTTLYLFNGFPTH
ncbi:MAG: hypothetical protein ACTSUN_06235 [Promethearchaeota archaeon]